MNNQTITLKENLQKSSITDGLNEEQKKAVIHQEGPLLIIAGAGTGKTTVITRRIAYLIEQKICLPSEILALTFTEKAAAEMEERVDQLVPYGFTDMWISTFHAFGDRLLRDYSLDLGLPANFKLLTESEQAIFIRENIYAFDLKYYRPIASPLTHIQAFLSHFSRLKDELIMPEEYIDFAEKQIKSAVTEEETIEAEKRLEIAKAYKKYQELMIQAGNLDFGDLIFLTYKLLKENKKILEDCQEKFKYILVDEYQDTNYAQNEIVKLLSSKYKNVTVVGDDDQSIYRFRGASISNIIKFKDNFDSITEVVLTQNYRSTQQILDSSYRLIQNNNPDRLEVKNNINKRLISPLSGLLPELLHCDTLSCEADLVVEKIKQLKKEEGYSYKDFSILARANSHSEPFIQALNVNGIPYTFSGTSGLFSQPEIKMLIAFLKSLCYPDDSLSFYQLATSVLYKIDTDTMAELHTEAKRKNRPTWEIAKNYAKKDTLFEQNEQIISLVDDIKNYRDKIKELNTGELLYDYLIQKNYLKSLIENPTVENELKIQNIAKFFDTIAQFNHSSEEKSLLAFLDNLELLIEVGEEGASSDINPETDAVNIMTAHSSKGLEWPVVFIVNCVSDRFPGRNRKDPIDIPQELIKEILPEGNFHLEEERRLFYVAATRAKKYLFITAADDYGGKRTKKISQFVLELLDESNPEKLKKHLSAIEKIERFKKIEALPITKKTKNIDGTIRLSRQQIDDYFTCPKKYYFAHIVKIPLLENHYLMYGTAIHAALDHYFNRKKRNETLTLDQLILDFKQAFRNVGFITRQHEDLRLKTGIATLTKFFEQDQKEGRVPSEIESSFEFMEKEVRVNGRYDLVYKENDQSEIFDCKTSEVKDQKDADKRIKDSTQMKIYALAWLNKFNEIPKTTLYFIESGLKGERIFTLKELDDTKNMIFEVAEGIKNNIIEPKPDQKSCKWCPYHDICPDSKA